MNVCLLILCLVLSIPESGKNKGNRNPHDNSQQHESVTSEQGTSVSNFAQQPPVNPTQQQQYDAKTDFLYRAYLAATIIGVIGGLIGLRILYKQFVATRIAAEAAKVSADAAQKSADVLIASQQPQITAKPHGNPGQDFCSPEGQHVQIDLYNTGLTTAYDCIYETWIEVFDAPFVDFTANAQFYRRINKFSLYPKDIPVTINIPIDSKLTTEQIRAIRQHQLFLCFRIHLTYRDSFSQSRYANFGYIVYGTGLGFLPKYNDSN